MVWSSLCWIWSGVRTARYIELGSSPLSEEERGKLGIGKVEKRKWRHTSNNLWTLKILIRMDVAWLQSQI